MRQEVENLGGGAETHRILKVPVDQLDAWDSSHDVTGRSLDTSTELENHGKEVVFSSSSEENSKAI